jgi:DNA processing protein
MILSLFDLKVSSESSNNVFSMSVEQGDWKWWIALRSVKGVGNVVGLGLVKTFGGPRQVLEAGTQSLECAGLRTSVARAVARFDGWAAVEDQLHRLDRAGGRLVTWQDEAYPELLRHIHDPPLYLYVHGGLEDAVNESRHAIAVVGSRDPSAYGRGMARRLSAGLVERGVTIVSGMARGIDAEAHWAALRAGGKTIAVLGCGIDVIYPSEHHHLMLRTAKNGAVVSEFPMGTQPEAENFPGRNRIISGLSLGTVVIEAAERSGSLITARAAIEQGREVFAVPGPVGARSRGPHKLLREGAVLAENANDVLSEIAPHLIAREPVSAQPLRVEEARVLGCLGGMAVGLDDIVRDSKLGLAQVTEILLALELRGLVRQLPGKCYALGDRFDRQDRSRTRSKSE